MPLDAKGAGSTNGKSHTEKLDALIIGAGVAGLYQLHLLSNQGLKVRAFDAASDVGGTWYWNRYPGARFDSEAYIYQYLFSEELYKGWSWSEQVPRPAGDRALDALRRRPPRPAQGHPVRTPRSRARITTRRRTLDGQDRPRRDDRHAVPGHLLRDALGAADVDLFPGQDTFKGQIFHTARWPSEPIDLAGKRVGVVGIGATGIQVIQTIAGEVGHLKVFVRTPQYVLPMKNPKYGPADVAAYKARFEELRQTPAPHLHRLRVRFRAQLGRPDAGAAPRGAGGRSTRTAR